MQCTESLDLQQVPTIDKNIIYRGNSDTAYSYVLKIIEINKERLVTKNGLTAISINHESSVVLFSGEDRIGIANAMRDIIQMLKEPVFSLTVDPEHIVVLRILKAEKKDFSEKTGCWVHFVWVSRTVQCYGVDRDAACEYLMKLCELVKRCISDYGYNGCFVKENAYTRKFKGAIKRYVDYIEHESGCRLAIKYDDLASGIIYLQFYGTLEEINTALDVINQAILFEDQGNNNVGQAGGDWGRTPDGKFKLPSIQNLNMGSKTTNSSPSTSFAAQSITSSSSSGNNPISSLTARLQQPAAASSTQLLSLLEDPTTTSLLAQQAQQQQQAPPPPAHSTLLSHGHGVFTPMQHDPSAMHFSTMAPKPNSGMESMQHQHSQHQLTAMLAPKQHQQQGIGKQKQNYGQLGQPLVNAQFSPPPPHPHPHQHAHAPTPHQPQQQPGGHLQGVFNSSASNSSSTSSSSLPATTLPGSIYNKAAPTGPHFPKPQPNNAPKFAGGGGGGPYTAQLQHQPPQQHQPRAPHNPSFMPHQQQHQQQQHHFPQQHHHTHTHHLHQHQHHPQHQHQHQRPQQHQQQWNQSAPQQSQHQQPQQLHQQSFPPTGEDQVAPKPNSPLPATNPDVTNPTFTSRRGRPREPNFGSGGPLLGGPPKKKSEADKLFRMLLHPDSPGTPLESPNPDIIAASFNAGFHQMRSISPPASGQSSQLEQTRPAPRSSSAPPTTPVGAVTPPESPRSSNSSGAYHQEEADCGLPPPTSSLPPPLPPPGGPLKLEIDDSETESENTSPVSPSVLAVNAVETVLATPSDTTPAKTTNSSKSTTRAHTGAYSVEASSKNLGMIDQFIARKEVDRSWVCTLLRLITNTGITNDAVVNYLEELQRNQQL